MTRDRRLRRAPALVVLTVLVTCLGAGCNGGTDSTPAQRVTGADVTRPTGSTSAGSPPAAAAASTSPDAPSPGSMQTPGSTSGGLSRRDFPRPGALGPGWAYAVDEGDAEEGYVGNGTPALARDPREIGQTAVPFGCARPAPMPLPVHALEVDYAAGGTRVITIRGRFADESTARHFYAGRRTNLVRCRGRGGGAVGPLVTHLRSFGPTTLLNGRTQASDPWMELALLDGDSVVLVAARNRAGRPPLNARTAIRIAAAFRSG